MYKKDSGQWTADSEQCKTAARPSAPKASGFGRNSSLIPQPSSFSPSLPDQPSVGARSRLNPRPSPFTPRPSRQGVLLLVVLALLAFFGLVAVAFVLISGHAQRSAKIIERMDQTLEQPDKLLNQAMMQVLRGPSNPVSVIGPHSLLEDIYGNNYITGSVNGNVTAVANGQILEFPVLLDGSVPLTELRRRIGCVLTFTSGPAQGRSTRILGINTTTASIQVLALEGYVPGQGNTFIINGTPFSGTGFGFNSSTGQLNAWDPTGPDPSVNPGQEWKYALLPNPAAFRPNTTINYVDPAGPGGANEDYDAADYQNMLLGAQIPQAAPTNWVATLPSLHRPALVNYWVNQWQITDPSITTWKQLEQTHPDFMSKILLRPLQTYNPAFTGSNPKFNAAWDGTFIDNLDAAGNPGQDGICDYQWDVDNDGDGVADSIWVDLGLPVRAAGDGRLYKPLFAILCVDLDGRLNLNAHGDLKQTINNYYQPTDQPIETGDSVYSATYFAGNTLPPAARGRGFGPADINLSSILPISPTNLYLQLLTGLPALGIEGRYGSDGVPGTLGTPYFNDLGTAVDPFVPNVQAYNDYLSANKWFEFDGLRNNTTANPLNVKAIPAFVVNAEFPDPQAKYAVGVDPAGRPILQGINAYTDRFDLPYELNLDQQTSRGLPSPSPTPDNPFSVDELARILRPFDCDATQLPDRLAALTYDATQNKSILIDKRREVTTESWDLPVYTAGLPTYLLQQLQGDLSSLIPANQQIVQAWIHPGHITDVLKAYYYYQYVQTGGMDLDTAVTTANTVVNSLSAKQLLDLFPAEMLAGLKMNINRPFPALAPDAAGNPSVYNKAALWQSSGLGGSYGNFWFGQMPDFPDGTSNSTVPFAARQQYARYLYVLALLLRDPNGQAQWFTGTESLSDTQKKQLTKRRIAQWAINAACYKINDSIMAPFEYDLNPFDNDDTNPITNPNNDTWNVDGRIGTTTNPSTDDSQTYRGLVWGCKPPELILTETLAFHNRRVADTRWEGPNGTKTSDMPPPPADTDFDQTRIPQGSAFFELYCPRDLHGSNPPLDLYDSNGRLDLGRLAPADTVNNIPQYPVWRMVISENNNHKPDNNAVTRFQDHPDTFAPETEQRKGYAPIPTTLLSNTSSASITIERIVWFADLAPTTNHSDYNRIYYNQKGTSALLERGHYAVAGPRALTILGLTGNKPADQPLGTPSLQRITLTAPNTLQVRDLSGNLDPNISLVKPLLAIVVSGGGPGTSWPTGWTDKANTAPNGIGISVSEPLFSSAYYPEPRVTGSDGVKQWYGDYQMINTDVNTNGGYFRDVPLDTLPGKPLADDSINTSFTANYKTVFLQRLANPLAPYDPDTNPYLTVDWMPIDLTVFKGDDINRPTEIPQHEVGTPHFGARQRGKSTANYNLWAPASDDPAESSKAGTSSYFDYKLVDSLGYLNEAFQPFIDSTSGRPAEQYGDPATRPFPWLPWFGRPYTNQLELMLVPASHPARLLWEFQPCTSNTNNYQPSDKDHAPFPQLLNFLQSGSNNGMNQFNRIFDYVGVPSWYVGTEIQNNPSMAGMAGTHYFFPPYNHISTYREPGRINLNTIYSPDVFNGLMNGITTPSWQNFVRNRRGYGASANIFDIDPTEPTQFLNPFRCGGGVFWNPSYSTSPEPEINATYLRPLNPAAPATSDPLFQIRPTTEQDVNNTERNPFFHYSELMRLGNLVTTRSNVYAVWITVGYFEVKPWTGTSGGTSTVIDAAHPDGYQLGRELGSDTGEIQRHRAFYIIDRTIPVGFERGEDLNAEKAIILNKYIE